MASAAAYVFKTDADEAEALHDVVGLQVEDQVLKKMPGPPKFLARKVPFTPETAPKHPKPSF